MHRYIDCVRILLTLRLAPSPTIVDGCAAQSHYVVLFADERAYQAAQTVAYTVTISNIAYGAGNKKCVPTTAIFAAGRTLYQVRAHLCVRFSVRSTRVGTSYAIGWFLSLFVCMPVGLLIYFCSPLLQDREFAITNAPEELNGMAMLRTCEKDAHSSAAVADFLCFDIDRDATVYILYMPRSEPSPSTETCVMCLFCSPMFLVC